jgi:[protein-PII] uridylyltransferase
MTAEIPVQDRRADRTPRTAPSGTPSRPGGAEGAAEARAPRGVDELRALLARERAAIEGSHRAGVSGATVVRQLADLVDRVVLDVAHEAEDASGASADVPGDGTATAGSTPRTPAGEAPARGWALVALGGYGRRELSPHSDVDIMVLHDPAARGRVEALAPAVFKKLWDLRLHLGHSVRTVADCIDVAGSDLATATSLLEARRLLGDAALVERMERRLRADVVRDGAAFVRKLVAEMRRGYAKHGSSLYMLEPNVKKSGGGLRTIHFLRWIALARHDSADLGVLHARGLLTAAEGRALREAQEFYWRVRNDLHFAAGHPADTLAFDDQVRLARLFGYRDDGKRLGVERFMQQVYIHATEVHEITERFIARTSRPSLRSRILDRARSRKVDGIFVVSPAGVGVSPGGRERLLSDAPTLLSLFRVSQVHGRPIDAELLDAVRQALLVQDETAFRMPAAAAVFLDILGRPGRLADTLSLMHRLGALEKLVPEFAAVNRLVQFNRFHKYTVDEHTFAVIRHAEALAGGGAAPGAAGVLSDAWSRAFAVVEEPRPAGARPIETAPGEGSHLRRAYAQVRRKDLLHLALLLHDVGKGRGGDHAGAGAVIAAAVARRLGLGEHDARQLVFLVREHLAMEQVALRRDLSDDKVLLRFARTVANPETLRMLFVLTYADIAGVGPGSWTQWKEDLLTVLYVRAMDGLAGGHEVAEPLERLAAIRAEVLRLAGAELPEAWVAAQWELLNDRYALATPPATIARHLVWLHGLAPGDVRVEVENDAELGTTGYTVLTHDGLTPGLFAKIAGVLAAKGLQILRAQVDTRKNGAVVDTFDVVDTFHAGPPPPERLVEVAGAIRDALLGRVGVEELFARHPRFQPPVATATPLDPTKVEVDNDSSDAFTIVDVFAQDRQGLLYAIAQGLWDLGLSVHSSKVATRLDQALDVFYVTDLEGQRVTDPARIEEIRRTLVERIERHERRPC